MADPPSPVSGLDDAEVERRVARLDEVLGALEHVPGRTAELAVEAVELLTEVYGEALGRVVSASASRPELMATYTGDELLRHLLLLHRLHPDPVPELAGVEISAPAPGPAFIPVGALSRRPASLGPAGREAGAAGGPR